MDRFTDDGKLRQGFTSVDDLIEVDIGSGDRPRPTFISAKLDSECKQQLTHLLKEYKDSFAWDYTEMPGLDRSIVEHRLPIKSGFWPHQQPARRCNPNIIPDIKAEITKLIKAKFIRQGRYAKWISNVVAVYKKNGKLCVCALTLEILTKLRRWMVIQCRLSICWLMLRLDIGLLASWMAMQGIIKYSWLKKIFPRLHLGVLAMLDYLNG